MGRTILKVVLVFTLIGGLFSGCGSLHHRGRFGASWHRDHHAQLEQHIAQICAQAALKAGSSSSGSSSGAEQK